MSIVPYRRPGNYSSLASNMVRRMFSGRPLNSAQTRNAMRSAQSARRQRRAGGRARTMQRSSTRSSAGVLGGTNADMRSIYRRKRMPKYKKRPWVRFVKKVHAVADKDLGTRTVLINDKITQSNTSANQSTLTLGLYTLKNDTIGYLNDLCAIGGLENEGNPTAAAGDTIAQNSKILFQSAVMDITIRNTTDQLTVIDPGNPLLNTYAAAPEAAVELDVYEMYIRKLTSDNSSIFASVTTALNRYDDPDIGGTGTGISIADRGCTPFELGPQMGRTGIKITKKTKFFIPNGQTITWQARDPKRRVCRYGDLTKEEGFSKPGWTKVYYLIYKLVPGLTQGSALNNYRLKLDIGLTRKYSYKVEGFNEPRERLLGTSYTVGSNN